MKKLLIVGMIVAMCAGCGGSSSVDKAIKQVENALEKVEKNKGNMTEADWQSFQKEVEEPLLVFQNALETDKIGAIGKMKIIALMGKCSTVVLGAGLSEIGKEIGIDPENLGKALENAAGEVETPTAETEQSGQ